MTYTWFVYVYAHVYARHCLTHTAADVAVYDEPVVLLASECYQCTTVESNEECVDIQQCHMGDYVSTE